MVTFTTGKLSTLNNHLLACEYSPGAVKERAQNWKHSDQGASEDEIEILGESTSSSGKRPRVDSTHIVSRKKQQKFTVVAAQSHPLNPAKQTAFEDQLIRAFVSAGWSFNSLTDPEVNKLFLDWIPGAKIPTRQRFSGHILNRQVQKIQSSIKLSVSGEYATVQCDGWKDISKRHLVAFMFTAGREVLF
jgi:hypothetical protein